MLLLYIDAVSRVVNGLAVEHDIHYLQGMWLQHRGYSVRIPGPEHALP